MELTKLERELLEQVLEQFAYDFQGRLDPGSEERLTSLQEKVKRVTPVHQCEAWQLEKLPNGGLYCKACGEANN